jgi:hypothetical protein
MDGITIADLKILLDGLDDLAPPPGAYLENKTWAGEIKGEPGGGK